jgi:hypothetical protein
LEQKGFVPVANISGVMIAYATAPGKTASDAGDGGGVYAKTLAAEIVRPGVESIMMFRNVQLKVKETIGQDPWLSFPTLPAVYFAGTEPAVLTPEQQLELAFWLSVKDSTNPAVFATYLERYPNGEFAAIARTLIEHYDRKLKAEQAAQEEERRRIEEGRKAAEVERLEEKRQVREAAAGEETSRQDEQQRAELMARTKELRKALEEVRLAREAAKAAEEQRLAAVKASEEATKAADAAIASKRDAEGQGDPVKIAALPKLDTPEAAFDGVWTIHRVGPGCAELNATFQISIRNSAASGRSMGGAAVRGSVSNKGVITFNHLAKRPPRNSMTYAGTLRGSSGSGRFKAGPGHEKCYGTFTARRG